MKIKFPTILFILGVVLSQNAWAQQLFRISDENKPDLVDLNLKGKVKKVVEHTTNKKYNIPNHCTDSSFFNDKGYYSEKYLLNGEGQPYLKVSYGYDLKCNTTSIKLTTLKEGYDYLAKTICDREFSYNSDNKLVEIRKIHPNGKEFISSYNYNINGDLTYYEEEDYNRYVNDYKYDDKGKVLEKMHSVLLINKNDTANAILSLTKYDTKGNVTELTNYKYLNLPGGNGKEDYTQLNSIEKTSYKYDDGNRIVETFKNIAKPDGSEPLQLVLNTEYNKNGLWVVEVTENRRDSMFRKTNGDPLLLVKRNKQNNRLSEKVYYNYNPNGKLKNVCSYRFNYNGTDSTLTEKEAYKYHANGKLKEKSRSFYGELHTSEKFDTHGNLIEKYNYCGEKDGDYGSYECIAIKEVMTYDAKGNWIKKRCYKNNETAIYKIVTRAITYYK